MAGRNPRADSKSAKAEPPRPLERGGTKDDLQERAAGYRAVLDAIPEMVFRIHRDGTLLDFIPAREETPALQPSEFLGRKVGEVLPADIAEQVITAVRRTLETGELQSYEFQLPVPMPDDELTSYEARLVPAGTDEVLAIVSNVTERKEAEEALRESEERFRMVINNAPVVFFALDREGIVLLAEGKGLQSLGMESSDRTGRSIFDTYAGNPDAIEAFQRGLAGQESTFTLELGDHLFEAKYGPLRDRDGEIVGVTGITVDVTERKRAEGALRESEERYRTLFEQSTDGLSLVVDGKIALVNPRMAEITGYPPEELEGREPTDFNVPEERERGRTRVRELSGSGEVSRAEHLIRRKDGKLASVESITRGIQYHGRDALLSTVRDITERKRADEALRESEERFRRLSEVSLEGIAIHENARITDANDAFAALGGYERAEVIGMRTLDVIAPESHDAVREHIQAEAEELLEIVALKKDGTKFPAEIRAKTLPVEDRTVRVVAVRDITQRKAQEAARLREREELEGHVERQMVHKNAYRLSFREYTVLHFVATGKADKEIARELGISPLTVQKHVASILAKMRAASRTEAGVRAVREGMLD